MRVAVAGATGRIGSLTVAALERDGHEVRRISREGGVNLRTGAGLETALTGVNAVIDALNSTAPHRAGTVDFFTMTTRNLLEAEQRAGVAPTTFDDWLAALSTRLLPSSGARHGYDETVERKGTRS